MIPVQGDRNPEQAKVAAVDWKPYQSRRATRQEIDDWFVRRRYGGVAIVTGRISNLVVLDFDEEALATQFARRFPALTDTRIVRSAGRCLPHYYFRLPVGVTLPSRRLKGLDVQADGRYVVAPPTILGDAAYRIERGGMPRLLQRTEAEQLQRFIEEIARAASVEADTAPTGALTPAITPDRIERQYWNWCVAIGRNHALFRAALLMRDSGWSADHALTVLLPLHIEAAKNGETEVQREKEARATIRSAYSRPRRVEKSQLTGLPNTVREALLQRNHVPLLRVMDGLLLQGVEAGSVLTEREICERLETVVGRYSILRVLTQKMAENTCFEPVFPFPVPHTPTEVATDRDRRQETNCSLLGVTPSDRNRGRPPKRYRIPSVQQLCEWLKVAFSSSDALTPTDLQSPAQLRRGMHREFVKRRPGTYHIGLVARRLNVVERTCQRYNRVCGVTLQPTYERVVLRQDMLFVLKTPLRNMFLEDVRGKRYPCRPEIAQRLLSEGRAPRLCMQGFNHYTHPDGLYIAPGSVGRDAATAQEDPVSVPAASVASATSAAIVSVRNAAKSVTAPSRAPTLPRPTYVPPATLPDDKRFYRCVLRNYDLELAASRLYHHLRDVAGTSRSARRVTLSMANARKLALQYGADLIYECQTIIEQRGTISNYAGFVVSFLRSETTARRLLAVHLS